MDTLLVFGSHPTLSLAEFLSWAEARQEKLAVVAKHENSIVVSGVNADDHETLVESLAGIVKVATVRWQGPAVRPMNEEEIVNQVCAAIEREQKGTSFTFGLSFYGKPSDIPDGRGLKRIGLTVKSRLRKSLQHVRWVPTRGSSLSSVQVKHNKLTNEDHAEYIVWMTNESFTIAKTSAVQLFEEWGARDFGRPRRNAKQGMLPPKLARMMVNLLGLEPGGILLDPFCGSGTILMEAALLAWPEMVGSDNNPRAVQDTKQNFAWLRDHRKQDYHPTLFTADIDHVESHLHGKSVRAVVTEPFLGSPQSRPLSSKELERVVKELLPLYQRILTTIADLLVLDGRAVLALPVWKLVGGTEYVLPVLEKPLPDQLRLHNPLHYIDAGFSQPLIYRRPEQIVGRQLVVLEKVAR